MSNVSFTVTVNNEDLQYVNTSARLRGISISTLVSAVIEHVLKDRMILSVLDDEDKPMRYALPERKASRPFTSNKPPADNLFDAVTIVPCRCVRKDWEMFA